MPAVDVQIVNPDGQRVTLPGAFAYVAPPTGAHAYFDALVARPDFWKGYSGRPQVGAPITSVHYEKQLLGKSQGGYAQKSFPLSVTYDAAHDAAKVTIPPFGQPFGTLTANVTASDTVMPLSQMWGTVINLGSLKIGDEVMQIVNPLANPVHVVRGQFGTPISAHAAGTPVQPVSNSLENQVWFPMGTQTGHTYLTVWDAWYDANNHYSISGEGGWKTFQFRIQNGSAVAIWCEIRTRIGLAGATNLGTVDARGYGVFGPGVTDDEPLAPQLHPFVLQHSRWVRHWALHDQTAADYVKFSLWVADEVQAPVQLFDRLPFKNYGSIHSFQLEFNSSDDRLSLYRPDMITYVRNVAMLRDVADVSPFLVKPT